MKNLLRSLPVVFLCVISTHAQNAIGRGQVQKNYEIHCMVCHGKDLNGGLGGSLLDKDSWKEVGREVSFLEYVLKGNDDQSMPAFEGVLSAPEIRALEIYIDEKRLQSKETDHYREVSGLYSSGGYKFKLETVVTGLKAPWSVAFSDNEEMLITEKGGALRLFKDGRLLPPIEGIPEVWVHGQGGLMEVALHPDYAKNGWVYLAYSASEDGRAGMTKVVRGRIAGYAWMDEEVIFEAPVETHLRGRTHFGTRLVFQDGYLFFSIGDRGPKEQAQDLSRPNGKVHRVHDDGRVPKDNPFFGRAGAFPTIWSYGNRNAQGLDLHPLTGELWESEHGPRGGDEINLIERGKNYGWPIITHGMNYNGSPITEKTEMEGMEQPKLQWTPSIAVCGIDFYEGDVFPEWKYDLFVGGLASQQLHRLEIQESEVVSDTIVLKGAGRVRDVASGPDGYLYLVLNGPDRIVRLVPAE